MASAGEEGCQRLPESAIIWRVSGEFVVNLSDFRRDPKCGFDELRFVECGPRTSELALLGLA